MKKLFFLLICFITIKMSAQDCHFGDLAAHCGDLNAGYRKLIFQKLKFKALGDNKDRKQIDYNAESFHKLLQLISELDGSGNPKYDGLRVYIGLNPDGAASDFNLLNLIFVPTIAQSDGAHADDLDHCWIIEPGAMAPVIIPRQNASAWIKAFQNGPKYAGLNANGKKRHADFGEETKSLWYKASFLNNSEYGLLKFFECQQNIVTAVNVSFGGFGSKVRGYRYHLTLLYQITYKDGEKYDISFTNSKKRKKNREPKYLAFYGNGSIDTGIPCPPPPAGSTCERQGSLLPQ